MPNSKNKLSLYKIPYLTLWVKKFEECVKFYKTILQLPVKNEMDNLIQFDTSGTKLYIHRIMEEDSHLRKHTIEVHFQVDSVDDIYYELVERGVTFEIKPTNMPWGSRIASFHDPEGYIVELVGPIKQSEFIAKHV